METIYQHTWRFILHFIQLVDEQSQANKVITHPFA